jgi:endonuclease/exonuclease/phosphatase family metal-dependent hydrolase
MDMGFVVLSYNVRHQVLDDGPNRWRRRRDAVVDRLRAVSPDIIGLQESAGAQQRDIERALDYRWYGVTEDLESGEHNPIGIGPRFVAHDAHTTWLSPTPDVQSVGWDGAYPRVLTQGLLEDTGTGRSLAVYNTHFDHKGPEARTRSARRIRERVDSLPADTDAVVLGDFNCCPGSKPYGILSAADGRRRLRDARTVAATVDGPTTTVTDFEALDPDRRLDHVFVTPGLSVESYRIDGHTADGRYPSDHLPVVAEVRFV